MSDAELIRAMTKAYWAVGTGREDMAAVLALVRAHDAVRAAPVDARERVFDEVIQALGCVPGFRAAALKVREWKAISDGFPENAAVAPPVEGERAWPAATPKGWPSVCLHCRVTPPRMAGIIWCDACWDDSPIEARHGTNSEWDRDWDGWDRHRASLSKGGAT